jgi:hypothetical protein
MMVVINMNLDILVIGELGQFPDSALLSRIDQDKALDGAQINLFQLGKIEEIGGGVEKKVLEILFLRSCKDERGGRIKFPRSNHGCQGVKVGIHVRCDYFFMVSCLRSFESLGRFHT